MIARFHELAKDLRRRPLLALLVLALLATIGLGGYVGSRSLMAEYHLRAAQRALTRGELARAKAHLALCLELRPRSTEVHFLAARTARRAGAYEEAQMHLTRCEQLQWSSEAIDLERTLLRAQRGNLPAVEGYLLAAVQKEDPEVLLILEALARGYMQTYRFADGLYCLDLLLQRQPDHVQGLIWRGQVQERRSQFVEAAAAYRRAVALDPGNDQARLRLAEVLIRVDQAAEAVEHFEHLRQRQPGKPAVLLGLARCRRSLGKNEEAGQLLDGLLAEHPGHTEALCERGKLALAMKRPAQAEDWLRRAAAAAPHDRETLYNLYQCLLQRGKGDEAELVQAALEHSRADYERAAELIKKISATPGDADLRYEAGVICLRNGQEQEGVRLLETALQVNPEHRPAHEALADYYQRSGQPLLAEQHAHAARQGAGRSTERAQAIGP